MEIQAKASTPPNTPAPPPTSYHTAVKLEPPETVENKSGRLDVDQLALDEEALEGGASVTYNINANYGYSPAEIAALQRLQELYPGQFTVNRIG